MALPASGLITLRDIGFEAGIDMPYTLSKLYSKMGAPASGTIRLTDFYGKSNTFTLTLSANTAQPNIRALATAAGWNGSAPLIVNVTAALINSWDLGSVAFAGSITLNISASTRIGGVRGATSAAAGIAGNAGTFAFKTRVPVNINCLGFMSGGGGSGSAGAGRYVDYSATRIISDDGLGGRGQGFASVGSLTVDVAFSGQSATKQTYAGAVLGGETRPWATGGTGGAGGAWGMQGSVGSSFTEYGGSYSATGIAYDPSPAGAAGPAVDGASYVAWGNRGTIQGALIN